VKAGYLSEIFISFQGEGAHVGKRHLFVRFAGCNLRCRYCDTPASLEKTASCIIRTTTPEKVIANPIEAGVLREIIQSIVTAHPPIDAIAITGGEPLMQAEFLAAMATDLGAPVLLETNGMLPSQLERVVDRVDIVSMDIKPPSNTGEAPFWKEHASFLRIARQKDLYVKVLVDQVTTPADLAKAAELVATEASGRAEVFIQPIMDENGVAQIDQHRLSELYLLARRYSDSVRVLPQTHKVLRIP